MTNGTAERSRQRRPWTFGRVLLLVAAILVTLLGLGLLAAGGAMLWADQTQREADGYLTTPTGRLDSNAYAIASESIDVNTDGPDWILSEDVLGRVRIRAEGVERDVFVGVGSTADVDRYLRGVEHDELTELRFDPFEADYSRSAGEAPSSPPTEEDVWIASASGAGEQTIEWAVDEGEWSIVVMNADASERVTVDVAAAAEADFLLGLAIAVLVAGFLVLVAGGALVYVAARETAGATAGAPPVPVAAGGAGLARDYPLGVRGDLDPNVGRWLWLVKWLLVLPHYVVLAFLWIALWTTTVVAFFAILFTRRYPRGIFDFNVGVLRWTWRVMFYSYWALGTDRYPPFTLDRVDDYPAKLEVAYPEQLSRWLPLVKWLLAIPHLVLVTIFVGGWAWGPFADDGGWFAVTGLVGILALIGGFALLFTGRYPSSLYDFVLGLDRWVFRVVAYVGLMTDKYPPFRLDAGPTEAGEADADADQRPRG